MIRYLMLFSLASLGLMLAVDSALANGGPPPSISEQRRLEKLEKLEKEEAGSVPLIYRSDSKLPVSKLIIPRSLLNGPSDKKPGADAPKGAGDMPPAEHIAQRSDSLRTVVAGFAMSLAMASLIFIRQRNRAVKAAVVMAICGIGVLAVATWSLAGAPGEKSERPPKPNGRVIIEIVEDGDSVQFIRGKR